MTKLPTNQLKDKIYSFIEVSSNADHLDNIFLLTKENIISNINTLKYENTEKEINEALRELKKEKVIKQHDIEKRIYIATTENGKKLVKSLREAGLSPSIASDVVLIISFALVFYFFMVLQF